MCCELNHPFQLEMNVSSCLQEQWKSEFALVKKKGKLLRTWCMWMTFPTNGRELSMILPKVIQCNDIGLNNSPIVFYCGHIFRWETSKKLLHRILLSIRLIFPKAYVSGELDLRNRLSKSNKKHEVTNSNTLIAWNELPTIMISFSAGQFEIECT